MKEQRRSKRFEVELPVEILRVGTSRVSNYGTTRNVSSRGALFTLNHPVELGATIEYLITLHTSGDARVNLRCMVKVVRLEKLVAADGACLIAATLERYEFRRAFIHARASGA